MKRIEWEHIAVYRGWMVMPHAAERFCERVAAVLVDEAHAWLTKHAHEAIHTGQVTKRGQPMFRLPNPWGPDAVLVVKRDPDGTRAVVTCGWWDDRDLVDDVLDLVGHDPRVTRGLQPRPAANGSEPLAIGGPGAPTIPRDLPCPPGDLDLSCIAVGLTLSVGSLSYSDMRRWLEVAHEARLYVAERGDVERARNIRLVENTLRQRAHERLMSEQKVASMRRQFSLQPGPMVTVYDVPPDLAKPMLVTLFDVLRDLYGDTSAEVALSEAKRRLDAVTAAVPPDAAE